VKSALLRLHVVCLCDVGGSGTHKLEMLETIARTINATPSLYVVQRPTRRATWRNFEETIEVRWGKVACRSTKA